jgi:hypothetical protein
MEAVWRLWPIDQIPEIVRGDLDPDFVKSVSVALAWEYDALFQRLSTQPHIPEAYLNEEFATGRARCATRALASAANQHGVPHEFRRLECNGQRKILAKIGRLIIIQEPMTTVSDHPQFADYKLELAQSHGILRQLELDLADMPGRILDWSGCILGVLLHGAAGPWFTREHKALGGLLLGIPDSAYNHWVIRFDLFRLAMYGRDLIPDDLPSEDVTQEDRVSVTLKKKNSKASDQ